MKTSQALYGRSAMKRGKVCPDSRQHSPTHKLVTRGLLLLLLAGMLGLTAGCGLLRIGGGRKSGPSAEQRLVQEQLELQRFGDDFFAQGRQALDESAERLGTDAGREQVLQIKLLLGSSVLSIVSGPNPNANLLDLVSITVLTRLSIQDYWMHTTNGAAFEPWLDASRVLETNVWDLAARFLARDQVAELRAAIDQWYAQTPEVRTAFFARPHDFARMVRTTQEKQAPGGSVFSLVNLAPAVAEVTQDRLFAERAMYTAQRLPFMLRLQGESFAYELAEQPSIRLVLSNSARVSDSVASLSQTVSQLPDRISTERKEVLANLESQQGKLRELNADVNRAMVSAEKMAGSATITITNFDNLMKRFGIGEPTTNVSSARPFNILEYAKTADEISAMAQNLNTLVKSMNQSAPEIQRLNSQASADLKVAEDRAFRLGLVLIAVLLTGAVLAGLVYRFFAEKLKRPSP